MKVGLVTLPKGAEDISNGYEAIFINTEAPIGYTQTSPDMPVG